MLEAASRLAAMRMYGVENVRRAGSYRRLKLEAALLSVVAGCGSAVSCERWRLKAAGLCAE
jgi:hypothetical protein